MNPDITLLQNYWNTCNNKTRNATQLPRISFDELTNSIFGVGLFYFYIIDFYDMSLSHVSPSINEFHGFDPETVTFEAILNSMHPDDMGFVEKAEAASLGFIFKNFNKEQVLSYKMSYHFRARMKDGTYALINHQALILTLDENGGYGKALNIHTRVDHISQINPGTFSLIGLHGHPSYLNLNVETSNNNTISYSKREIEIIKLIADGLTNKDVAQRLFISPLTVKKHRKNILDKSECKNFSQLIKQSIITGII